MVPSVAELVALLVVPRGEDTAVLAVRAADRRVDHLGAGPAVEGLVVARRVVHLVARMVAQEERQLSVEPLGSPAENPGGSCRGLLGVAQGA